MTERWQRGAQWMLVLLVVAAVMRFAALMAFQHVPESDEIGYRSMALNLVNHGEIVDVDGSRAGYSVGYPLFVLAPVFHIFGDNLTAARYANLLLGLFAVALCGLVAREAGAGRRGSLIAAGIWAVYLPASLYTVYLFKENLLTPLMLGLVWVALRLASRPSFGVTATGGIVLGLITLVGNAALVLALLVVFALVRVQVSIRMRLGLFAVFLACAVAVPLPWMIRNIDAVGAPVVNTNGGFNLYLGNNPAATGKFVSISDTPRATTWQELRKTGELNASEVLKQDAIDWIRTHPAEFIALSFKKAVYFWTPPFHEGKGQSSNAERVVRLLWAIEFCFIVILALTTIFYKQARTRAVGMLWMGIAVYTAVHMLFYVIFRYREPIMPLLVVLAAIQVEAGLSRWFRSRNKRGEPQAA